MKRLIVCCDGTWNNPDQEDNGVPAPTNVFKLYNAVETGSTGSGVEQLAYYHPGVGGEGGFVRSVVGGAIGAGISRHIRSAYHWLATHYEDGDEIYLYGFSRGAFTVRSLCGFLARGLLDLRAVESKDAWARVETAYDEGYRGDPPQPRDQWAQSDWAFFHGGAAAPIRFIGVWDTVGALGVPDDLEIANIFDDKTKWQFHDTTLGSYVQTARHAMALDEIRSSFSITHWRNADEHGDAKELWFPGAHSDVGGGYAETDLSNGALLWMIDQSGEAGLKFRDGATDGISANPLEALHNSYQGAFAKLRSRPRNIPAMVPKNADRFHSSALTRQQKSPISYPAYHPTRILEVGESTTIEVFAGTRWNYTGLYLERGQSYLFSAVGEWQDGKDACDWRGTDDGNRTVGDLMRGAASFLGGVETLFKRFSGNESTDFVATKRVENFKWFTLVGAIANDGGASAQGGGSSRAVANDGSPIPHQYVDLPAHESQALVIDEPGYLYCFPNDAWAFYDNNRGSVLLKVRREA